VVPVFKVEELEPRKHTKTHEKRSRKKTNHETHEAHEKEHETRKKPPGELKV
jgi:hypothetical protein